MVAEPPRSVNGTGRKNFHFADRRRIGAGETLALRQTQATPPSRAAKRTGWKPALRHKPARGRRYTRGPLAQTS